MLKNTWKENIFYIAFFISCITVGSAFANPASSNKGLVLVPMNSWTGIGIDMINGPSGKPNPAPPSEISQKILQMGTGAGNAQGEVVAKAMEKTGSALVGISVPNDNTWVYSGSGIIYDATGLIVTNAHVIGNNSTVQVVLNDKRVVTGVVKGRNDAIDLAVIKITAEGLKAAEFGDSSSLQLGEVAIVMGNPLSLDYRASVGIGIISGLNRHIGAGQESFSLIQTDAPINPGNSGGALVNSDGQVIGINSSKLADAEGIGFAIPINTAKLVLDRLTNEGHMVQSLNNGTKTAQSSVVAAIKRVSPSIIGVSYKNKNGQNILTGSGIIYKADEGLLVTSYTSVKDNDMVIVTLADGRSFEGEIIGSDAECNLAVLRIEAEGLEQPSFGDSAVISLGDRAIVIGNSVGLELSGSVTVGIISGLNRTQTVGSKTYPLIQTDAALNEGNGGSALVNEAGQVMGINIAKMDNSNTERIGFAIPMNTARTYINEIIKKANAGRPYLGMNVYDETWAKENGMPTELKGGVGVLNIMPGSPVAKAGILPKDIVLSINGHKVPDINAVAGSLKGCRAGDTVEVKLIRNNKPFTLKVLLEALTE